MKKIISYSLWGDKPMYNVGAIHNAHLANEIYPGWISRFYLGRSVPNETIKEIKAIDNTQIVIVESADDWTGMFWRFFAIDDSDVTIFRDTDSRLSNRERIAVNEWLESYQPLHIMRDHPLHSERIMGGMWGVKSKAFMQTLKKDQNIVKTKISSFFELTTKWLEFNSRKGNVNRKGIDQEFLRTIYKLMSKYAWIQDQFPNWNGHSNRHPSVCVEGSLAEFSTGMPVPYQNKHDFIGQVYDENNVPVEEYANILQDALFKIVPDHPWNKK